MPVGFVTGADLTLSSLQTTVDDQEGLIHGRLLSMVGQSNQGVPFNAHSYELVDDDSIPLTRLFVVTDGGDAANDPAVTAYVAGGANRKIVFQGKVYVQGSLATIAFVR